MPQQQQQNQQPMHGIVTPHENDVLSGRGNFVNYHCGNEQFRALVKKHKVAYVACPKPQKGKFSKMIVDEVRALNPPGRFLKQDEVTKLWYDIGDKKAMDKTRQALREGAPDIIKELTGDEDDDSDSPISRKSQAGLTSLPSPGMSPFGNSPLRQAPARSVSCQPQLLNGMRRDSTGNFSAHSPGAYMSPGSIGLHNTIHNDSRLQPIPSLNPMSSNLGSHSHHAHQAPQRTPSIHLSTAGNLATMQLMAQQQNLSQSLHSPAQPQAQPRITLSQHLSQQSPQQQQILQRQQELLMQQRRRQQQPMQQTTLPQHLPMSPQSLQVGQQQQLLQQQQQHLSLSQHATESHQRLQQQQMQQQFQQQQMPQHHTFRDQLASSQGNAMQSMPPLYQPGDMQNSAPGAAFSSSPAHGQFPQSLSSSSTGNRNNPLEFARPLAPAPKPPQAPPLTLSGQPDDNSFGESERLAPLPTRSELKLPRDKLKREGSESSLQVDNIFPSTVKTKKADGSGPPADYKNQLSSSHMSIMSLSVGDMGLGDEAIDEMPSNLTSQLAAIRNEKDLSSRFNSSLRLGRRPGAKRSSVTGEPADISQSAYMDMSVATMGDRLSEFGDMSVARMTESQANMSFTNVFEETDKDICADGKL